jgi:hypothetical protein
MTAGAGDPPVAGNVPVGGTWGAASRVAPPPPTAGSSMIGCSTESVDWATGLEAGTPHGLESGWTLARKPSGPVPGSDESGPTSATSTGCVVVVDGSMASSLAGTATVSRGGSLVASTGSEVSAMSAGAVLVGAADVLASGVGAPQPGPESAGTRVVTGTTGGAVVTTVAVVPAGCVVVGDVVDDVGPVVGAVTSTGTVVVDVVVVGSTVVVEVVVVEVVGGTVVVVVDTVVGAVVDVVDDVVDDVVVDVVVGSTASELHATDQFTAVAGDVRQSMGCAPVVATMSSKVPGTGPVTTCVPTCRRIETPPTGEEAATEMRSPA